MRVLVVDDSKAVRMKLARCLSELGHTVVAEADNGKQALDLYATHKPDLITLDIVMPIMDGLQALKALMAAHPNANAIMVSSAMTESNLREAKALGAKGFLMKPFQQDKLEELLKQVGV